MLLYFVMISIRKMFLNKSTHFFFTLLTNLVKHGKLNMKGMVSIYAVKLPEP